MFARKMTYSVYLSLGSNINPEDYIPRTVRALNDVFEVTAISSVHRTAPVKMVEDAEDFHNLCVEIRSDLEPEALKQKLRQLEGQMGRDRSGDSDLYQSRVIDIDIILYEPEPEGFDPHPQVYDEAFVVYPLSEIYDPSEHEDLPETREAWKSDCDDSIMLGRVTYDWSGGLGDR
ncbi:MAG: 2-amino-4-hydroxy-6-hydroxymethyldihydropteridine diphosphokinase [bacterium]